MLSEGATEAYGKDIATGRRVAIPALQWRELEAFVERGRDVLRPTLHGPTGRIGYDDIEFHLRVIMALWLPHRLEAMNRQLPATVPPWGPGFMPLYCAAHWIATEGGTILFRPA